MSFYRKTFDILLKKYKFLRLTWHFELLFNSLDTLQTKPLPPIRHICDFSRGVLNVRFMRSHPTLAPRPQICLIGGNGFCAVAGEDESNRGAGIWGQKLMSSAYSRITGNRGMIWLDYIILEQEVSLNFPFQPL